MASVFLTVLKTIPLISQNTLHTFTLRKPTWRPFFCQAYAIFNINIYPYIYCVVTLQVPVSKPHPRSRAQCSHLWVPVTAAGISGLFLLLMDRDLKQSRGLQMLLRTKRRTTNWAWRGANSYVFFISGWTADWPVEGTLDKWMYGWTWWEERKDDGAALLPGWSL